MYAPRLAPQPQVARQTHVQPQQPPHLGAQSRVGPGLVNRTSQRAPPPAGRSMNSKSYPSAGACAGTTGYATYQGSRYHGGARALRPQHVGGGSNAPKSATPVATPTPTPLATPAQEHREVGAPVWSALGHGSWEAPPASPAQVYRPTQARASPLLGHRPVNGGPVAAASGKSGPGAGSAHLSPGVPRGTPSSATRELRRAPPQASSMASPLASYRVPPAISSPLLYPSAGRFRQGACGMQQASPASQQPPPCSPMSHARPVQTSPAAVRSPVWMLEPQPDPSPVVVPPPQKLFDDSELIVEDLQISIENAVAMLPPSAANTLSEFLSSVASGDLMPAMCCKETTIDTTRYWEKRRVQNSLRRLVEALQEVFGLEGSTKADDLGGRAWDQTVQWTKLHSKYNVNGGSSTGLCEAAVTEVFEALGAWPPEMSLADRGEVFAALLVPSSAAVKALCRGQPLPRELSKRMLREGLLRVPYNVPDFPVPTCLIAQPVSSTSPLLAVVVQAICSEFYLEDQGVDRVKDFFLSALISLEEIQAALPKLEALSVIEKASLWIIRSSWKYLTPRELQTYVYSVRIPEEYGSPPREPSPDLSSPDPSPPPRSPSPSPSGVLPSLASPGQQHRPLAASAESPAAAVAVAISAASAQGVSDASPQQPATQPFVFSLPLRSISAEAPEQCHTGSASARTAEPRTAERVAEADSPVAQQASTWQPRAAPMTEPLPMRHLEHEEPVNFQHAGSIRAGCLINWSTPIGTAAHRGRGEHQADEGAGSPAPQWNASVEPEEVLSPVAAAAAQGAGRSAMDVNDPVAWISMEMHNECHGPFLARAFVRCCQLHEARRGR